MLAQNYNYKNPPHITGEYDANYTFTKSDGAVVISDIDAGADTEVRDYYADAHTPDGGND